MTVWPGVRRLGPAREESADAKAVRIVAWLRLCVVVAVAAAGSFAVPGTGDHEGLYLLVGLLWAPWACVVLLAADDPGRRLALVGGPVGDVVALFTVQTVAPAAARTVLFGYLVTVAFAAFTAGRTVATGLAASAVGLALVATSLAPEDQRLGTGDLLAFAGALAALLLLARRSVSVHALVSARAEGLRTKAEVILATVVGGVVVTDSDGVVLQANPAAERIIGSAKPMVGRPCQEALGLHADSRALDCSQGCALLRLAEQDSTQGQEVWRTTDAGEKQPILASAVTLRTGDGTEVVHSLQDITRLKQAEEAKTLFLATASHELKTPLTVINGFAETLTKYDDLDPATQQLALGAIRTRARELTRVVDRLLLSSRIEAGRVALVTSPVSLPPLLHDRVDGLAQATNREITCDVDDAVQLVQADADAFVTVVDHLLENALKYSPAQHPVRVTAGDDGDRTWVAVRDEGIGMDAEQTAHCFDKFWQAESTDVRRFGGTGIGLYIVHSLVEAMGGRIAVESTPGAGTTFRIELAAVGAVLPAPRQPLHGEPTSIREFMRQIGVPSGGQR
jgi:PAS domain S-box-containing protein